MNERPDINIHIERLVLDGVYLEPNGRALLEASVRDELTRLLAEGGLSPDLASGGAVPSLHGGSIQIAGAGGPGGLGQQIARAVYGGIGQPNEGGKR